MATMPAAQLYALAEELGGLLRAGSLVLATAESCTAGGVAFAVTQVPGSSAWFDRAMVVYSNEAKQRMLDVPATYLRDFGAVSEPVARAMALGALQKSHAHVSVGITGIAGPDGGTEEKPVGTVCFAFALRRDAASSPWVQTHTRRFAGDRSSVRTLSIIHALEGLIGVLRSEGSRVMGAASGQGVRALPGATARDDID
jgi:nicotinamide-nucleotide amidase